MMTKILMMLILPLLLALTLKAQTDSSNKVVVYKPFNLKDTAEVELEKEIIQEKNMLKWNYSMLFRGVFLFNFERYLKRKLSFEIGVGPAFRDFFYELSRENNAYIDNNIIVKTGIMLEGGLRYYPVEGDMGGIYISGSAKYRKYNSYSEIILGNAPGYTVNTGYQMSEVCFIAGKQWEYYSHRFTYDAYLGVAYGTSSYNDILQDASNLYYAKKITKNAPRILIGCKFCLPF